MPPFHSVDCSSPDYEPALRALEWSLKSAKALGYTVPLGFDIAIRLMRGELTIPLYSDLGASAFGIITSGRDYEEDHEEMFALYIQHAKRRKERERAMKAIGAFASAIEAGTAETAQAGSVHESAVAKPDARKDPS